MRQIAGNLVTPLNQPASNVVVRVTAVGNAGGTMLGMTGSITTGGLGEYSFELVAGIHKIEVHFSDEYILIGEVVISTEILSPITLPELMNL